MKYIEPEMNIKKFAVENIVTESNALAPIAKIDINGNVVTTANYGEQDASIFD